MPQFFVFNTPIFLLSSAVPVTHLLFYYKVSNVYFASMCDVIPAHEYPCLHVAQRFGSRQLVADYGGVNSVVSAGVIDCFVYINCGRFGWTIILNLPVYFSGKRKVLVNGTCQYSSMHLFLNLYAF